MTRSTKEKYPIGTEVYYSVEDYRTGKDVIYKGVIQDIFYHDLRIGNHKIHSKFYKVNEGISMMENCFYTINELFEMKNKLEELLDEKNSD